MVVFKNGDWRDATVTQQRKPEAIPMKGHSMNSAYIDNPSGGGGNPAYAMIMHSRFEAWKKQKESAAVPVFDQFFKEAIAEYFQINGV